MTRVEPEAMDAPLVVVVDDDPDMRAALEDLLRSAGIAARSLPSTAALLHSGRLPQIACLLLDVRMPGLSGLDLQARLAELGIEVPVIFLTGFGDVPTSVRAMKRGAVDFLTKPVSDQDLLDAVHLALRQHDERQQAQMHVREVASLARLLTQREREVMTLVVSGLLNKQIAGELAISEVTVKLHRGNVMRKMRAVSVPDLVRKASLLQRSSIP
jgi:FixJ family two-component response regulator